MTESKKRGRPFAAHVLTPAEKQKAYRERQALKIQLLPDKELVYKLQAEVENLKLLLDLTTRSMRNETKRANDFMEQVRVLELAAAKKRNKSNVTKIYKQVDILD